MVSGLLQFRFCSLSAARGGGGEGLGLVQDDSVTDESIRVCHVTDPAELRQTVCHHRGKHFPKGTAS